MADIYSIGVLAWKLFNGFEPQFPEDPDFKILPSTLPEIQELLTGCLKKEPWKRPSINQLIEGIESNYFVQ